MLKTCKRNDIACKCLFNFFTVVRVHHHHAPDPLLFVLRRIQHCATFGHRTGIDTNKGQRAHEWIIHNLEGKTRERLIVISRTRDATLFVFVAWFEAHIGRHIQRAWQEVDNSVQHGLHAFVLERRTTENRHERHVQCAFTDQLAKLFDRRLFTFEIGFHRLFVLLDSKLDELAAPFFGFGFQGVANLTHFPGRTEVFASPDPLFHGDQVDMTFQLILCTDRNLNRCRDRAGAVLDHLHTVEEVSTDLVHLVDEHNTWNVIAVSLAPHGFGLRLNAGIGVQHTNCAIQHSQRTLNLNREVDVSGRVDDIEAVLLRLSRLAVLGTFPEGRRRSRGNRDTTLLLLLHPVHGRGTIVHFADLVRLACVIQNALGRCGLTGVDMRHDTKVTIALQRIFAGHWLYLLVVFRGGNGAC